jgi:hypothetical protein
LEALAESTAVAEAVPLGAQWLRLDLELRKDASSAEKPASRLVHGKSTTEAVAAQTMV